MKKLAILMSVIVVLCTGRLLTAGWFHQSIWQSEFSTLTLLLAESFFMGFAFWAIHVSGKTEK